GHDVVNELQAENISIVLLNAAEAVDHRRRQKQNPFHDQQQHRQRCPVMRSVNLHALAPMLKSGMQYPVSGVKRNQKHNGKKCETELHMVENVVARLVSENEKCFVGCHLV